MLAALLACAPTKSDSVSDSDSGDLTTTTTTTVGHSSAPTGDPSVPTTTAPDPTTIPNGTGGPDPGDPSVSTTAPPDPTIPNGTGGPDPGDDDSAVPFDPIETTVAFISTSPDLPPGDCDPWAEDCPDGQKCAPFATPGSPTWDAVQCVPIVDDPAPAGAPCSVLDHPTSGLDDCVKHAMCWDLGPDLHGTCVAMCLGDGFNQASCLDPDNLCVQANDNVILVCLPRCDPLLSDCPEGQVCIPSATDFACAPDASGAGGQAFTPCAAGNACDPGLLCADSSHTALCDPDVAECCLPFCDLDQFDSCPPDTACIPVFPKGGVEPQLLDVGLCGEP